MIENTDKVSLETHAKDIEICSYSTGLNVPKSIYNIIARGEEIGYSETQFGEIFLLFIKQHLPDYYTSAMSFSMSTNALFNHLVSLIDTSSQVKLVRKELSQVSRKPGESIASVALKVKSLTASLLWMLEPSAEMSKISRKSDKASVRSIPSFLEQKTRKQFNTWSRRNIEMEQ